MRPGIQTLRWILPALLLQACNDGSTPRPLPPEAPSGLSATAVSTARIDLAWTDNSDREASTAIERSLDGIVFVEIARVLYNVTAYSDLGLDASTLYTYRVRAVNSGGPSDYTPVDSATTQGLAWVQPAVAAGPGPRSGAAAIYDPLRQRMILVGGYDDALVFHNDVWALSLPAPPTVPVWTQLLANDAVGAPARRWGHGAVYDPVGDRLVLFGGQIDSGLTYTSDVHFLSLGASPAWSTPSVTGTTTGRVHAVALYDPLRHELLIYGGEDASTPLADAAALSLTAPLTWRALSPPTTPLARSQAAAVLDPVLDRAVLFGGFDSDFGDLNYANGETHALASAGPGGWTNLAPSASPPIARGMRAVLDTPNRRMVFWSGDDTEATAPFHQGLWALNLDSPSVWIQLLATSPMPGRIHAAVVYDALHRRMVVVGGEDETAVATDTVEWIGL